MVPSLHKLAFLPALETLKAFNLTSTIWPERSSADVMLSIGPQRCIPADGFPALKHLTLQSNLEEIFHTINYGFPSRHRLMLLSLQLPEVCSSLNLEDEPPSLRLLPLKFPFLESLLVDNICYFDSNTKLHIQSGILQGPGDLWSLSDFALNSCILPHKELGNLIKGWTRLTSLELTSFPGTRLGQSNFDELASMVLPDYELGLKLDCLEIIAERCPNLNDLHHHTPFP